jgi:hypothetical protein
MNGADIPLEVTAEVQPLNAVLGDIWRVAELGGNFRLANSVGAHRITAFASAVKAGDLLSGIAALLNLQWTDLAGAPVPGAVAGVRGGILVRPNAARQYDDGLKREFLEIGAAPLFQLSGFTRIAPQQWKQGRPSQIPSVPVLTSYNIAALARQEKHAGLRLLSLLGPTQRRTLIERQSLVLEWGAMSQAQREAALSSIGVPLYDDRERPLSAETVNAMRQQASAWVTRYGVLLAVNRDPASGLVTRFNHGGEFAETMTSRGKRPQDRFATRGHPYENASVTLPGKKGDKAKQPYAELENTPFPPGVLPEDDASLRRVSWPWILGRLAQKAPQLALLSDAFTGTLSVLAFNQKPPITARDLADISLAEGLDRLCDAYKRVWWREESGLLLFRSRTWFLEQEYEVPEMAALRIAEELRRPTPNWSRLLNVFMGLTREQLQGFAAATGYYEQLTSGPSGPGDRYGAQSQFLRASHAYDRLQIFRELSSGQQARALSRDGLPVSAMGEEAMVGLILAVQDMVGADAFRRGNDLQLNILVNRIQTKPKEATTQVNLATKQVGPPARQGRLGCQFLFRDKVSGPITLFTLEVQSLLAGRKEIRRSTG